MCTPSGEKRKNKKQQPMNNIQCTQKLEVEGGKEKSVFSNKQNYLQATCTHMIQNRTLYTAAAGSL